MIKPICERGSICIFLVKSIEKYSYPINSMSDKMKSGEELVYYCTNPVKLKNKTCLKKMLLNHKKKFASCELKTTNILEEFTKC